MDLVKSKYVDPVKTDSINEVVEYVNQITSGVSNVSNNMTVISAAVEEQSVTMSSIADTAIELQQI